MSAGETTERSADSMPRLKARIAGLCYLLMLPTGGLAMFVRARYVIKGDAATTAANMMAHEPWFRMAFAGDLLVVAIYIVFTALMYDLMKPVSRNVSLLAALFSLMGCATQAFACLFELAPLLILSHDPNLGTFKPEQLHSLAYLSLKLYAATYGISLVFFGFYNLVIGYLVFKSTFLPRILGVLMAISCLVGVTFLWPPFATQYFRYLLILDVGELLLVLWLLIMGVNAKRWLEQAEAATSQSRRAVRAG